MHMRSLIKNKWKEIRERHMLDLIIGGSASGKSAYGEKLAYTYYQNVNHNIQNTVVEFPMYYVATLMAYDEESRKRIKKHQNQRKEKPFKTIECFYDIRRIKNEISKKGVFYIECMSNLLANEIYAKEGSLKAVTFEEQKVKAWDSIITPILELSEGENKVVLITNEIFSDGGAYDRETKDYIALLGYINECLSKEAEHVVEVVCSIPVSVKGTLPC